MNDGERPRKPYTYYNALEGHIPDSGRTRRCGETTRLIDKAIQLLFEHGAIVVEDHWFGVDGRDWEVHKIASEDMFRRIQRRLRIEHPGELWIFDFQYRTIERKGMGE